MKNKIIVTILIIFTFSYIFGNLVYSSYRSEITPNNTIYYLNIDENYSDKTYKHITVKANKSDFDCVGITADYENAKKIVDLYKVENISVNIVEGVTDNMEFYNELVQYDILLKNADDYTKVTSVLSTILSTYEEILQLNEEY